MAYYNPILVQLTRSSPLCTANNQGFGLNWFVFLRYFGDKVYSRRPSCLHKFHVLHLDQNCFFQPNHRFRIIRFFHYFNTWNLFLFKKQATFEFKVGAFNIQHFFFPFSMPGRLVTLSWPQTESCLESCLVKIEISQQAFSEQKCWGDVIPGRSLRYSSCFFPRKFPPHNVGIYTRTSNQTSNQMWVYIPVLWIFSQKMCEISPLLLPKASRRGVAQSGEVAGGEGGSQGGLGWKLGNGFLAPSRSRFFLGSFFKCVCLG